MANLVLKVNGSHTAQNIRDAVSFGDKSSAKAFLNNISKAIKDDAMCELQILNNDAVAASDTITFSDVATANDTVIINGVTFTGKASPSANNEFAIGATASDSAAGLTAAIKASTTAAINTFVTSSSAAGVCTVTALNAGVAGNTITVTTGVDSGMVQTVATARLTGGTNDTGVSVGSKAW